MGKFLYPLLLCLCCCNVTAVGFPTEVTATGPSRAPVVETSPPPCAVPWESLSSTGSGSLGYLDGDDGKCLTCRLDNVKRQYKPASVFRHLLFGLSLCEFSTVVGACLCFFDTGVRLSNCVFLIALLGEVLWISFVFFKRHTCVCPGDHQTRCSIQHKGLPCTDKHVRGRSEPNGGPRRNSFSLLGPRWIAWTWLQNEFQWGFAAGPARTAKDRCIPGLRAAKGLGGGWRSSPLRACQGKDLRTVRSCGL